jgi:hypothetical protein
MEKRLFTIAMVLLLSLSILTVLQIGIVKADTNIDLPDAELLNDFNQGWGPSGYTVVKTDETGPGVRFTYTGLDAGSAIATHDGYWGSNSQAPTTGICLLAGGLLNSHGYYDDFHTYTYYRLLFTNVGTSDLSVDLYMNTGYASSDPTRDTWYESDYTDIKAGESRIVTLDFSSAKVDNAGDDPDYTHYPRFTLGVPMVRLDEVTGIGFQVLKKTGDGTGALVVSAVGSSTWMHMDPSTTKKTYTVAESFFDVFVDVENVPGPGLYGFDLKVTWDSSLLELTGHDYDTYLAVIWNYSGHTDPDYGVTEPTKWDTPGECRLVAISFHTNFTGSSHLLKLTFKVLNPLTNSVKQIPLHFEIDKLSDEGSGIIAHACADGRYVVWGLKPALSTKTTDGIGYARTCQVYHEEFNVKLIVSDAASVTDCTFEIHYDKTHVSYHDVDWGALGTGSISDDLNGKITGSVGPGTPQTGTKTIVTIVFHSIVHRIWKSIGGWTNEVNSAISIQKAELTYSSDPKLTYDRGDTHDPGQITIGANFGYTFSPIKGDCSDNNGKVEIDDLSAVALCYDGTSTTYNLVGTDDYVDIFDLVVVASNFWYEYTIPPP